MKKYALYYRDASGHEMFITKDRFGKPFFLSRSYAISYAEGITGTSAYLITMSKDMELLKP